LKRSCFIKLEVLIIFLLRPAFSFSEEFGASLFVKAIIRSSISADVVASSTETLIKSASIQLTFIFAYSSRAFIPEISPFK